MLIKFTDSPSTKGLVAPLKLVILSSGLSLFAASDAAAYIDLGTGSYVLQALLGGLMVAGFTLRTFWSRIKARFIPTSTPDAVKNSTASSDLNLKEKSSS